ncbi:MAG: hypothetical protein U0V75_03940 [Ferruginibacter sp.]
MKYSFKAVSAHNSKSIIVRHLPRFIWPVIFIGAVQYFFPESSLAKNHLHLYILLAAELFSLYGMLTDDSINEIEVDLQHKKIHFYCYSLYQGQMHKSIPFDILKVNIENAGKNNRVRKLEFCRKKLLLFTLTKQKDHFSQQDLDELKALLNSIVPLTQS